MKSLGELLRELRGEKSLRDVAEVTQLSHTYISDIEKGYRRGTKNPINPSPDTLKRLSKAYNYPYEELMKVAGYIEEDKTDDSDVENKKSAEEIYDDPDFQLAMRSAQGFSEENKKRVLEYIEMIEELEKGRKPGDRQPRSGKR